VKAGGGERGECGGGDECGGSGGSAGRMERAK
jgi:hypothetical protein